METFDKLTTHLRVQAKKIKWDKVINTFKNNTLCTLTRVCSTPVHAIHRSIFPEI